MGSGGFMEMMYDGALDAAAFRSYRGLRSAEKVESLVDGFRGLLTRNPPLEIERNERVPEEVLKEMGAMGFFALSIPESYGGLGLSLWEYMAVVEKMAEMDLSVALISLGHLSIGVKGIVLYGDESQKEKYLRRAASGETIFAYALTEPRTGSDAKHIETVATLSDDGKHYVLNGRKTYITNANYAGAMTVFAQMDPKNPGYMGAFIVETNWDGVKIGKDMPKMGLRASSTAAIQFQNVLVPKENLIGKPGDGFKIAVSILSYGRLGLGAASVGMMRRSSEDMLKRAASRVQFGVPIGNFQLIQEKIVRTKVHGFISSAMNNFTASLMENSPDANVAIETSHCKLFGTTRAWDATYDALQTAGGSGYIMSQPYEKRTRDWRVTTIFEGTSEIHSTYPAQLALRRLGKELASLEGGKVGRWQALFKKMIQKSSGAPMDFDEKTLTKALRFARGASRAIRVMLAAGLALYGNKVFEMQFFLRRVTTLSLYAFGVLAATAKIAADRAEGVSNPEELHMLEYFLEEAREARKANRRILTSRKEKLSDLVYKESQSA
jgi:acyl-CoA dehydrogenase family protein 9